MTSQVENIESANQEFKIQFIRKEDGQRICMIEKYPDFASIYWRVDPLKTKEEYLHRLVAFYTSLKESPIQPDEEYPSGILLIGDHKKEEISLDQLTGDPPEIIKQPLFKDFYLLRIDTQYADFGMQSLKGP